MLINLTYSVFQLEEFQRRIYPFIENQDTGEGNQFWPVVRQIRLFVPGCPILKNGVKLVDLPGTRDSNAARDKIAKDVCVASRAKK